MRFQHVVNKLKNCFLLKTIQEFRFYIKCITFAAGSYYYLNPDVF
jgi:hypothetical protein